MDFMLADNLSRDYEKRKDFYVVLSSNDSKNMFPNNSANNFTVSYEKPFVFTNPEEWKVALTEISYNHTSLTVKHNFGISFTY
jgi:hypothetical protein